MIDKNLKIIISLVIISLLVIPIGFVIYNKIQEDNYIKSQKTNHTQNSTLKSTKELIFTEGSDLSKIVIKKEVNISGNWYAVVSASIDDLDNESKTLLYEDGDYRDVIAGPGTSFSKTDLQIKGVPSAVMDKFNSGEF